MRTARPWIGKKKRIFCLNSKLSGTKKLGTTSTTARMSLGNLTSGFCYHPSIIPSHLTGKQLSLLFRKRPFSLVDFVFPIDRFADTAAILISIVSKDIMGCSGGK